MCLVGFSPRSAALVLYAKSGAKGEAARLAKLGKYKGSTGCLYVKRLADLDLETLEELVRASADHNRGRDQCDVCVTHRAETKKTAPKKVTAKVAAKVAAKKPKRRA
jgi:hypothetical protein